MIDIALFSKRVKECRENLGLTVRARGYGWNKRRKHKQI